MNFEKKLVILTGKEGKGTALIEHSGMGVFLLLNVFSLPDLKRGEYALGIKTGSMVKVRELGALGRVRMRMELPDGDYSAVHVIVFEALTETPVLYGTSANKRMWEGNLMDGLRRRTLEQTTIAPSATPTQETTEFEYSGRKIEDYFLDILPGTPYTDNALAEADYFAAAKREKAAQDKLRPLPAELERAYLKARFAREGEQLLSDAREIAAVAAADEQGAFSDKVSDAPIKDATDPRPSPEAEPRTDEKPVSKAERPDKKIKGAGEYTVGEALSKAHTSADFYTRVKPEIERLLANGERLPQLETALPGSRWVRIDYDERHSYAVGVVGEAPDFLAYGVPGTYARQPRAFSGADFVPLQADRPTADGYWVLFQSARTGEEIKKA